MSDQKRRYRMTRRAELEQQTRQRITESAVALHQELGPARTSISAIAERAGVRRSTVYRHFPDEESLFAACSTHWRAANPAPDARAFAAIADPAERTEIALRELYAFYRRTEAMYTSLLRDEPIVPIVQRLLRGFHDYLHAVQDVLMAGRGLRGRAARGARAAIGHAVAFPTWRSLTHEQGLADDDAVALMCLLVEGATTCTQGADEHYPTRARPEPASSAPQPEAHRPEAPPTQRARQSKPR
ncbi:MAG TPA: helix-turn-helix domain-containing protein [Gaiellaceae bacterium]|nr:helix-turn-helix domain-containing protein [Gaiellaceae bacterium]